MAVLFTVLLLIPIVAADIGIGGTDLPVGAAGYQKEPAFGYGGSEVWPPFMWAPYHPKFQQMVPFWTYANEMEWYRALAAASQSQVDRSGTEEPISFPCYRTQNVPAAKRMQRYQEIHRCNGLYKCLNGLDEAHCPQKCMGPLYNQDMFERDCRQSKPRYQYNHESRECEFFTYGGCVEKRNMFLKKSECERECDSFMKAPTEDRVGVDVSIGTTIDADELAPEADADELIRSQATTTEEPLPVPGEKVIEGSIPCNPNATKDEMHYYNETDRCNGAYDCPKGEDEHNCMLKCLGFRYTPDSSILDCRASIPRWYYDFENQKCVFFYYGGCALVYNQFLTEEECKYECQGVYVNRTTAFLPTPATTDEIDSDTESAEKIEKKIDEKIEKIEKVNEQASGSGDVVTSTTTAESIKADVETTTAEVTSTIEAATTTPTASVATRMMAKEAESTTPIAAQLF